MNPLPILVKSNIRSLFRSRATVLALVLVPLLLLFFAGLAFDTTSIYRVRVGVHAKASGALADSVMGALQESDFRVQPYDAEEACVQAVRLGDQHACLVVPEGFALGSPSNVLTFHVDPSRAALANAVVDVITARIAARSVDISRNLTRALVSALTAVKAIADQRKDAIVSLTTQVTGAAQGVSQATALVPGAVDLSGVSFTDTIAQGEALRQSAKTLSATASATAALVQDRLDDIDEAVNASNLSASDKSDIHGDVTNASNSADALQDLADTTGASVDASAFATSLQALSDKLTTLQGSISQFGAAQSGLSIGLSDAKARLDASLLTIVDLQRAFNDISASIAGITVTDPEALVAPIKTSLAPVTSESSYLNYVFPLLIVLVLLFSGMLLPPILILTERNSSAAYRTFLVPVKDIQFMASVLLSCLVVLAGQALVMLAVASFFFSFWLSLPVLLAALVVVSTLFILLGMLVGYAVRREFHAVLVSLLAATALLFASDFIVPLDVLPQALAVLAQLNPVVIGGELIRTALLFGASTLAANVVDLVLLVVYAGVVAVAVVFVYRNSRKFTLEAFLAAVMTGRKKR